MKIPGKPAMKKQLRKKRTNSAKTAAKMSSEKTRSKKAKAKAKKSASTGDLVGLIGRSRTDVAKRKRGNEESSTLPVADVPLGAGREYDIPGYDDPSKPLRRRKIHKRRKVPRVKKGEVVEDPEPTPPADIEKR